MSFVYGVVAAEPSRDAQALLFVFRRGELLVAEAAEGASPIPRGAGIEALGMSAECTQYMGALDGVPCLAIGVADDARAPAGHRFAGLRVLYDKVTPVEFAVAGTASQIVTWERGHRFCSKCGREVAQKPTERAKRCDACGIDYFPRVQPAIIVLIHDGSRVLMARSPGFPEKWYALIAGFVEPGETFEECVAREVLEETGVRIDDIRYFGSQPWPFPHQVMVGFWARWTGGDIVIDRTELEDARWFDVTSMPQLPPAISIARRMIDAWVREKKGET